MNREEHQDTFLYIVLMGIVFIFLIYMIGWGINHKKACQEVVHLQFEGSYSVGDSNTFKPISIKEIENLRSHEQITLKGHFNQDIPNEDELYLYMYRIGMCLKKNGSVIYFHEPFEAYPESVSLIGGEWCRLESPGISKADEIEITLWPLYQNKYKGGEKLFLNYIFAGDYDTFVRQQVKDNIIKIAISGLTFILGLVFLVSMHVLKFMKVPVAEGWGSCSMLILNGGICTFIDYSYVNLIIQNEFIVSTLDFMSQVLIFESLMIYLKTHLISKRFINITRYFIGFGAVVISVCFVVQFFGYMNQLYLLECVMPMGIFVLCIIIFFLGIDYVRYPGWRMQSIVISSVVLGIFALVEMAHYYITDIYWIFVFQIGLLIFTIMQISMLLRYTKENMEKAKRADELEKEIIQNRMAIMLSQIQPHFLHNTITSIQELCLRDAAKAHTMLTKFSQFLRGNMDSLTATSLIPFEKELKHVQNYLYLEKVRYGNYLNVAYEIEVSDFLLPALSVQPIVENAVRYGVGKKEEGGTVIIHVFETEEDYRIMIEDDGIGMSIDGEGKILYEEHSKSHVGLKNVQNRLAIQCGGNLEIQSKLNEGTKVTICIPKGGN